MDAYRLLGEDEHAAAHARSVSVFSMAIERVTLTEFKEIPPLTACEHHRCSSWSSWGQLLSMDRSFAARVPPPLAAIGR